MKKHLKPGGTLVLAAFGVDGPTKCSNLDICQYDSKRIQAELGDDFQQLEEVEELHITPANREQKFIYFRFVYNNPL